VAIFSPEACAKHWLRSTQAECPTRMSGGNGNVDLTESVDGMVKIVNELDMSRSGKFLYYTGADMAW